VLHTRMLDVLAMVTRSLGVLAILAASCQLPLPRASAQSSGNPCGACNLDSQSWDCPAVVCNKTCVQVFGVATCK